MNLDPQGQLPRGSCVLGEFSVSSVPGNEREAAERVADMARRTDLPPTRLEQLKTAVAEAVLNAMEHGNQYRAGSFAKVRVIVSERALVVRVADQGMGGLQPRLVDLHVQEPDLAAKLAGEQSPRGWGLFLIAQMTDNVRFLECKSGHTVELLWYLDEVGGGKDRGHATL
jgi:anti-sigma regulatory factor (Ser/Thr protein kinase)